MLEKYYVGDLEENEYPQFPPMSEFYITLKKKIEDYFAAKKLSPRYAPEMISSPIITLMLTYKDVSRRIFCGGAIYFPLFICGFTTSCVLLVRSVNRTLYVNHFLLGLTLT